MRILFWFILILGFICFNSACQKQLQTKTVSVPTQTIVSTLSPPPQILSNTTASELPKENNELKQTLNDFLTGFWKRDYLLEEPRRSEIPPNVYDCPCNECLDIQFNKINESFCVEGNQISVSAYFVLDEKRKKIKLYFKEPTDLGRGGAGLPWKSYDRKKPLAVIDVSKALKDKQIRVKWSGFSLKGKKQKDRYGELYEGIYYKQ